MRNAPLFLLFCGFGATSHAAPKLFYPLDKTVDVTAYVDENRNISQILTWFGYADSLCAVWTGDGDGSTYDGCKGNTYDNHTGTDYNVPNPGTEDYQEFTVYAAAAGMVVETKTGLANAPSCKCYGNYVKIDHGGGWFTIYGHLKKVWVTKGQTLDVHTALGIAGNTGASDGDHLHFEVRMTKNGKEVAVDPYQKEYRALWCNDNPTIYAGQPCDDALWHPAGTLVSPNSPDLVYLVLEDGITIAPIPDDDTGTFTALHYDWSHVVNVSTNELDCFQKTMNKVEAVPFGFFKRSSWFGAVKTLYFYYGAPTDPKRYRIEVPKSLWNVMVQSWGFTKVPEVSTDDTLYHLYPKAKGTAKAREGTLFVNESGEHFVVANGRLHYLDTKTFASAGYLESALITTSYELMKLATTSEGDAYAQASFTTCGAALCTAAIKPNALSACVIAEVIDADHDGVALGDDCDDHDPKRSPYNLETCNDYIDNNCNGAIDEDACLIDSADDEEDDPAPVTPCAAHEDCLTTIDDDCNGLTNEIGADHCLVWYADIDHDGCGTTQNGVCQCAPTPLYPLDAQNCTNDCNDYDAKVGPSNVEICGDFKDNNCNGVIDETCATGTCATAANGTPCDDGTVCTGFDACANGVCTGMPLNCNDHNECTDDACVPTGGCVFTLNYKTTCNDGNACSTDDRCIGQSCQGSAISCDDDDVCTADFCSADSGCYHEFTSSPCADDYNVCTFDACNKGICQHDAIIGGCTDTDFFASDDGYSDDVIMTDTSEPDYLIENGSFESGLSSWTQEIHAWQSATMYSDCMVATDGACSAAIANSMIQSDYQVQLTQQIALTQGITYECSIDARTAQGTFPMRVWIGENSAPWSVHSEMTVQLTSLWQSYTFTFVSLVTDAHAKFSLVLGSVPGTMWIDNVSCK